MLGICIHQFHHILINLLIDRCHLILCHLLCFMARINILCILSFFQYSITGVKIIVQFFCDTIINFLLIRRWNRIFYLFGILLTGFLLLLIIFCAAVHKVFILISDRSTQITSRIGKRNHHLADITLWKTIIFQCIIIAVADHNSGYGSHNTGNANNQGHHHNCRRNSFF